MHRSPFELLRAFRSRVKLVLTDLGSMLSLVKWLRELAPWFPRLSKNLTMSEIKCSHLLLQADKYRKELEICCNDLSTCLEINSTLTK